MPIENSEQSISVLNIVIDPSILWFILAILIIFFLVLAGIFNYHWKKYGVDNNPKVFAKSLFWIVSIFLVLLMTFCVIGFEYI